MSATDPFRVYASDECGADGYPLVWHDLGDGRGVKHLVREYAGHRCVRCSHPYIKGAGEWSPCDERCTHSGPLRCLVHGEVAWADDGANAKQPPTAYGLGEPGVRIEARWRILTVHHLQLGHDAKRDLRWWNLAALCQRCHLQIQGKVVMERIWPWPHTEWFRPYAAGWYAWAYLGEDLTRAEVAARVGELLALEAAA